MKPVTTTRDKILWAAMQAMVNDIHAPQDNLSEAEWQEAEKIMCELNEAINAR